MPASGQSVEQKNVCINQYTGHVFFESQALAYNYRTDQWTRLPAVSGKRFYSVQDNNRVLGTIEAGGQGQMMQDSSITGSIAATATIETADFELEPGFQSTVDGCQPLANETSITSVRIGVRDILNDTPTYITGTAIDARTGFSHFRNAVNYPTGAYHRVELTLVDAVDDPRIITGAYFEFFRAGRV